MKKEFKFIHVADLHLDVPMKNIVTATNIATNATFTALDNLVQCALEHRPDAVLFVGDIWNHEDASLKARLSFKNACEELNRHNIHVYLVHGNHDPLTSAFQSLKLPENVHVFPDFVESVIFEKQGESLATIHGISHTTKKETRNLSEFFQAVTESSKQDTFHVGMLHTSLAKHDGSAVYAPCSIADLKEKNMHYWALGHVHSYQILERNPHIIFSGALQGTHINEDEAHGAVLVRMSRDEETKIVDIYEELIPLAPLFWKKLDYTFNDTIQDIVELQSEIYEQLTEITDNAPACTRQLIVRICLKGETELNKNLRNVYTIQEIIDSLNEQGQNYRPIIFVKDIEVETSDIQPEKNIDLLMQYDDFLAQVLSEGENLLNADVDEMLAAMQKIYQDSPIQKQHRKTLPLMNDEESFRKLIKDAQYICAELLDNN